MLATEGIHAGYGSIGVLQNVTMSVASGEFLGLIGPNGCGKTTLLRAISGILLPSQGQVWIQGRELPSIGRRELAQIMACLMQDPALDLAFTVREVTLMGRSPYLARLGRETKKDFEAAQRAMDLADVSQLADRPLNQISGGERQRALIAMCLAQEPEILLLDEPTSHLDLGHQLSLLNLIRDLNRRDGMTVVGVFHDLNLAAEYCDRLLLLDRGRVASLGKSEEVLTVEMIQAVFGATVFIERNRHSGKPHILFPSPDQPSGNARRGHG
jgi:iron complex transport system ATP-binding protein